MARVYVRSITRSTMYQKLHFVSRNWRYRVNMISVTSASRYITSASRYHSRYQSGSSMYIRGLIPRNFAELVEAVPIAITEQCGKVAGLLYFALLFT